MCATATTTTTSMLDLRKWRDVCLTGACRRGHLRAVIGATLHASNNNNTNCEGRMSTPLITVISAVECESWQSAAAFVLLWRDNQLIMIKLTEKLSTIGWTLGVFCKMILFLFRNQFPVFSLHPLFITWKRIIYLQKTAVIPQQIFPKQWYIEKSYTRPNSSLRSLSSLSSTKS